LIKDKSRIKVWFSFLLAGFTFFSIYFFLPSFFCGENRLVFAIICMGIVLWVLEPIPISMTSIIIILGFVFTGYASWPLVVSGFSSNTIFLCMGGFMMAQGVNSTVLGKRLAYILLLKFGGTYIGILAGILILLQIFSFFVPVSSIKIFLLLPPIMVIVEKINEFPNNSNMKKVLFLALTYGTLISAIGILPGALVNIITVDIIEVELGITVTYYQWLIHFLPASIVLLFLTGLLLLLIFPPEHNEFPGGLDKIENDLSDLGNVSVSEIKCIGIIFFTVFLWITQSSHGYPTAFPALLCPILMALPGIGFIKWEKIINIDWNSIMFIGVVLSVMTIIQGSSIVTEISDLLLNISWFTNIISIPFLAVISVVFMAHILHLVVANTVIVTILLVPTIIQILHHIGDANALIIAMVGGTASLLGFILNVQTMPNMITYSFRYYTTTDLALAGVAMSFITIIVYAILALVWWPLLGLM